MIIGHSNCEKGFKVYNISDNDHNQWRTSLKVDSNMTCGQFVVNNNLASEASQKKKDFDVSNQLISEFGLHYWRQIIFFHCAIEHVYFF